MTRCAADRGSAGLLMVWVAAVVLAAATAAVVWGGAVVARHRATRTADLAALAAAGAAASGDPPCPAAVRVARPAGADVATCELLPDGSVLVVVELGVPVAVPGLDMPPARARARAGAPMYRGRVVRSRRDAGRRRRWPTPRGC